MLPAKGGGAAWIRPDARPAITASARAPRARRLHSDALFGAETEVEIAHGDAVYRLRRTALGKLILTK